MELNSESLLPMLRNISSYQIFGNKDCQQPTINFSLTLFTSARMLHSFAEISNLNKLTVYVNAYFVVSMYRRRTSSVDT